jgi:cytochrome c1
MFKFGMVGAAVVAVCAVASAGAAQARTCEQLRTLCHGMRDDKRDCIKPYQGCLKTGVFVTPLGRVFKATR